MSWLYLVIAICFEVMGITSMKLSDGLTKLLPTVGVFFFYGVALVAITFALKKIDLSVAYAIWSALGTALIAVIGVWYFREPITLIKTVSLILIIIGVVGLNLDGGH